MRRETEKIRKAKEQEKKGKQRTPEDEFRDLVKNEERKLLSEDRKRILREIKNREMPEIPTKFKVSPKVIKGKNKVVGADMMKQQEIQKSFKPKPDNIWGNWEYAANVRASQEKKNDCS